MWFYLKNNLTAITIESRWKMCEEWCKQGTCTSFSQITNVCSGKAVCDRWESFCCSFRGWLNIPHSPSQHSSTRLHQTRTAMLTDNRSPKSPLHHSTVQAVFENICLQALLRLETVESWNQNWDRAISLYLSFFPLIFFFERVRIRSGICLSRGQHQSQTTDNRLCTKMDDDKMSSRTRPGSTVLC